MLSKDNQVFILFSKKRQLQLETTCAKMKTDKWTHYVSHGFVHKSQKRTQSIFYGRISPQGSSVPQGDKKQLRLWLAWGKKTQPVHSGNTNLSLPLTPSTFSLKSFSNLWTARNESIQKEQQKYRGMKTNAQTAQTLFFRKPDQLSNREAEMLLSHLSLCTRIVPSDAETQHLCAQPSM